MPRPRSKVNRKLPNGLRCRDGYYSYPSPLDGREYGLGRDRMAALKVAIRKNSLLQQEAMTIPDGYLGKDEILAQALPVSETSGVYFLIHDQSIVYVGQSLNLHARIAAHVAEARIPFNRFHFIRCHESLLLIIEARYIAVLQPQYNRTGSMQSALKPVRVNGEQVA